MISEGPLLHKMYILNTKDHRPFTEGPSNRQHVEDGSKRPGITYCVVWSND